MKITRSTFKSFINKNTGKLWIDCKSDFDGMVDMVTTHEGHSFHPVQATDRNNDHTLGIGGLWLVGQSRDWFTAYENEVFTGIEVSNCCGNQVIAVKK